MSLTCSCCCRASSICCCCFSSSSAAMFLCSECAPSSCSLSPLSWLIIINNCSSFSARDSGVPGRRHLFLFFYSTFDLLPFVIQRYKKIFSNKGIFIHSFNKQNQLDMKFPVPYCQYFVRLTKVCTQEILTSCLNICESERIIFKSLHGISQSSVGAVRKE